MKKHNIINIICNIRSLFIDIKTYLQRQDNPPYRQPVPHFYHHHHPQGIALAPKQPAQDPGIFSSITSGFNSFMSNIFG